MTQAWTKSKLGIQKISQNHCSSQLSDRKGHTVYGTPLLSWAMLEDFAGAVLLKLLETRIRCWHKATVISFVFSFWSLYFLYIILLFLSTSLLKRCTSFLLFWSLRATSFTSIPPASTKPSAGHARKGTIPRGPPGEGCFTGKPGKTKDLMEKLCVMVSGCIMMYHPVKVGVIWFAHWNENYDMMI